MIAWAIPLVLANMAVPAISPAEGPLSVPADPARLSLVEADSVAQTDPQELCGDPLCTSLFLTSWKNAATLAGTPFAQQFTARMEMGSPFNMPYRLVLVIEHRPGMEPLVRAVRGFNDRTNQACFQSGQLDGIDWHPEGERISYQGKVLCVSGADGQPHP